jgi:hypothetical protein
MVDHGVKALAPLPGILAACLVAVGPAACGGASSPDDDPGSLLSSAIEAMAVRDWTGALRDLDRALERRSREIDADEVARARVHRAECLVRAGRGAEGKKAVVAQANEESADWKDVKRIGEALLDEDFRLDAIELLAFGAERFPDREQEFEAVLASIVAESDLDPETAEALRRLGYVQPKRRNR